MAAVATLILLAACSSTPPREGSRQADDATCTETATADTDKVESKRFLTWLAAPVTRWSRIDRRENACMTAKGWAVTRTCTDAELQQARTGPQPAIIVVTTSGIRCRDPGRPL